MKYFTRYKYNDRLYQIKDALGVLVTLVIGDEKALLFDTGYGIGDLPSEIKDITDKPLIVVNSHGHMDHSAGNYQFDEVYINQIDYELVKKHNSKQWRERNLESARLSNCLDPLFDKQAYIEKREGNLIFLETNQVFDLVGFSCRVIPFPGHTKGSIALLIPEMSTILVSDATCPFVWLFLDESTSVSTYIHSLKSVLELDFDYFLVGHGPKLLPRSRMEEFLYTATTIDMNKTKRVVFKNFEECNSYCYTLGEMYDQNSSGIIFDPNK